MIKADLEDLYNSKYYEYEEFGFKSGKRADFILKYLNIKPDDRILEIGCGLGILLEKIPSKHKIGLETNDIAINECKKRGLDVRKADAEKGLRFDNSAFDFIIMHEVIEHLHKPGPVIDECFRVLAKSGKILITTPVRNCFFHDVSKTHYSEMTADELKKLLGKHGFKIKTHEVCGISFLYPILELFLFKPFRFLRYVFMTRNNQKVVKFTDSCHNIADITFLRPFSIYRNNFLSLGLNQLVLAEKNN